MNQSSKRIRTINKILKYMSQWNGSTAAFCNYSESHDRFSIALRKTDGKSEDLVVDFIYSFFISGPTRWKNCELLIEEVEIEEGEIGFEVSDKSNGFLVRCGGISISSIGLHIPTS